MQDNGTSNPEVTPVKCWACGSVVPNENQIKCLECEVWLKGIRKKINFSVTSLALVTALVGVGATGIGSWANLRQKNLEVREKNHIETIITATGLTPSLTVINVNTSFQNLSRHRAILEREATCSVSQDNRGNRANASAGNNITLILINKFRALPSFMVAPDVRYFQSEPNITLAKGKYKCRIPIKNEYGALEQVLFRFTVVTSCSFDSTNCNGAIK